MKRLFDLLAAVFGLMVLLPFFVIIAVAILTTSRGGVFFAQTRIGKHGKPFRLLKFRTMVADAEKKGQLTVGGRDPRVTGVGHLLRKTKLDELPQLINIIAGDMSFVGPRPEVPRYVELYTEEQRKVLEVRPGLTDLASLEYFRESELLGTSDNPEHTYIHEIMPEKLRLNLQYIENRTFWGDIGLIFRTIGRIFR